MPFGSYGDVSSGNGWNGRALSVASLVAIVMERIVHYLLRAWAAELIADAIDSLS